MWSSAVGRCPALNGTWCRRQFAGWAGRWRGARLADDSGDLAQRDVLSRSGAGLDVFFEMEQNLGPSRIAERQIGIVVKPLAIAEGDQGGSFGVVRESERQRFACGVSRPLHTLLSDPLVGDDFLSAPAEHEAGFRVEPEDRIDRDVSLTAWLRP
jgi:hypothetical protein